MSRRAAIYARISKDRTGAGLGVARQEEDCRELAERLGWDVVAVHTDNDISAYSGKPRPGYSHLLDDLRAGRANAVIAWHADRLHRSPRELEEYIDVCEPRGIVTHTVKAGDIDLSTSTGRAMARTLGAWARQESEQKAERIRRQKRQALETGKYRGGGRPFGFESDGMTVREDEAACLREASSALLNGRSLASIVRDWNTRGVRTSTGGTWRMDNVRRVLTRARNAGLIEHEREIVGPAAWPAIVDEDTWRAVVALLRDPSRLTNRVRSAPRWLGSGIYICGECGDICRVVKSSKNRRAYTCASSRSHISRLQEPVDDLVRLTIAERLAREDVADLLASEPDPGPLAAARERAQALAIREDEAAEMFATGAITAAQLATLSAKLRSEREAAEREIAAASEQLQLGWLKAAPDPVEAFLTADLDAQRAALDALMRVTILKAPRGRPAGWQPGDESRIDPAYVRREFRRDV
ncbi:recombinase family protein [Georgenia deserti]|uniref:Recombinase family protein n=1 Tax=Georgenia deserti TaxID=2093781 RepID=A0ABW4L2S7_9MICO